MRKHIPLFILLLFFPFVERWRDNLLIQYAFNKKEKRKKDQ